VKKFPSSLIRFCGLKRPQEIFNEIGILIHTSLRSEPFGRVIVEGFSAGVPVISTCLGGAGELVRSEQNGLKFLPYDYAGLLNRVKKIIESDQFRSSLVQEAQSDLEKIELMVREELKRII